MDLRPEGLLSVFKGIGGVEGSGATPQPSALSAYTQGRGKEKASSSQTSEQANPTNT